MNVTVFLDIETTGDRAAWPPDRPTRDEYVLAAARAKVEQSNRRRKSPNTGAELDAEIAEYALRNRAALAAGFDEARIEPVVEWSRTATKHLEAEVTFIAAKVRVPALVPSTDELGQVRHGFDEVLVTSAPDADRYVARERHVVDSFTSRLYDVLLDAGCDVRPYSAQPKVVTWKGAGFDVPILRIRAFRYCLPMLARLVDERRHVDLHEVFTGRAGRFERRLRYVSSTAAAAALGLEPPHDRLGDLAAVLEPYLGKLDPDDAVHGSHLPVLSMLGRQDDVDAKCIADLDLLSSMYDRIRAVLGREQL